MSLEEVMLRRELDAARAQRDEAMARLDAVRRRGVGARYLDGTPLTVTMSVRRWGGTLDRACALCRARGADAILVGAATEHGPDTHDQIPVHRACVRAHAEERAAKIAREHGVSARASQDEVREFAGDIMELMALVFTDSIALTPEEGAAWMVLQARARELQVRDGSRG